MFRAGVFPPSPPKLGGVAAPSRKCREATSEGADGVVLLRNHPAVRKKRANGTPPNLGGELGKHQMLAMPQPTQSVAEIELELLLEGVYRHYGFDFRNYALSSLRRRVGNFMRAEEVGSEGLQLAAPSMPRLEKAR